MTAHGYIARTEALLFALVTLLSCFVCVRRGSARGATLRLILKYSTIYYTAFFLCVWQVNKQRAAWLPSELEGLEVVVVGQIQDLPANRQGTVKFNLLLDRAGTIEGNTQIELSEELPAFSGVGVLALNCYECRHSFVPGDTWRMIVKLKRPHGYASWGAFDYEKYLFRKSVIATGYLRQAERAQKLAEPNLSISAQSLRAHVLERVEAAHSNSVRADEPSGSRRAESSIGLSMMLALTIGYKAGFSSEQRQVFQQTGVAHIMVISGLHIGLLFGLTSLFLSWCINRRPQILQQHVRQHLVLLPALMIAALYAALAGFSIPTQRALLMLSIYAAVRFWGREVNLLQILLVTAVIIVVIDPLAVLDVGFWMSFSAVFTIGLWQLSQQQSLVDTEHDLRVSDQSNANASEGVRLLGLGTPQQPQSTWRRMRVGLGQLFHLQLCIVMALIPLGSHFFGQVSFAAVLVNLIAIPVFGFLLIPLSLLLTTLISLWPDNSTLIDLITILQWAMSLIYAGLQCVASLPMSSLTVPKTPILVAIPVLILAAVLLLKRSVGRLMLLVFLFVALPLVWSTRSLDRPVITLLDVGQGLSMVVRYQAQTLVYDVGPRYRTGFNTAEAVLLPYLFDRGVNFVDTLIISHADNDHIGGYNVFVERMPVGETLTSRVDVIPSAMLCNDQTAWRWGALRFAVISPSGNTPAGSNNRSCVLQIEYGSVRVLLTGDIEKPVERFLLQTNRELNADILLVPHQGSKTSSTEAFIDAVNPRLGLVAAGYRNQYRHPHPEVVKRYHDRGIRLLQTPIEGSVEITLNEDHWTINGFRQEHPRPWHAVILQANALGR